MQVLTDAGDVARHSVTGLCLDGPEEKFFMAVMCRGKRFHITISPENLREYQQEYTRLYDAYEDSEGLDFLKELEDWVLRPFLRLFSELAPELSPTPQKATVAECFNPPTLFFTLESVHGVLSAVRTSDNPEAARLWIPCTEIRQDLIRPELRIVRPKDLEVVWDPRTEDGPDARKVTLGTTEHYFLKQLACEMDDSVGIEAECLLRLEDMGVLEKIRVPKLHGFVQYEDENRIAGLLLTFIDARETLAAIIAFENPSDTLKLKWMYQVEEMLEAIHHAGVVWGDATADNVLIDKQDNAWIIDFAGFYTSEWNEEIRLETVEGDLQGICEIKRSLGFA